MIKDFNFEPGAFVLVRNSRVERELDQKTKPWYLGPMVVIRCTYGGSYILAELDGAVSTMRYAAFRLLPYYLRSRDHISVTQLTGLSDQELDDTLQEPSPEPEEELLPEGPKD